MKPDTDLAPDDRQRGFWYLFVTQFQGAFSDNALKWLAIFVITGLGLSNEKRDQLVGTVGALFALPFIAFSMTGGFLADRFSKRSVSIGVKLFEILVMLLALAGLATNHLYLTISCVFLMGVHSAIFGPSKYGLLPELLPERKLSWGNGILELGTFLAIIGGTVAGGWLCKTFAAQPAWSGVLLVALLVGQSQTGDDENGEPLQRIVAECALELCDEQIPETALPIIRGTAPFHDRCRVMRAAVSLISTRCVGTCARANKAGFRTARYRPANIHVRGWVPVSEGVVSGSRPGFMFLTLAACSSGVDLIKKVARLICTMRASATNADTS